MTDTLEQLLADANASQSQMYHVDWQSGRHEQIIPETKRFSAKFKEQAAPYARDARGRLTVDAEKAVLQETQQTTATMPDLLRMGLRFDAFTSYAETPSYYAQFARTISSDKQQEEYLKDAAIGTLPVVHEGQPYPEAQIDMNEGLIVRNFKRGYIVPVTLEMRKFDQLNKVRQLGELMGRAARLTEEQAVMSVITTTANYTRTSTAGDNDETAVGSGANQQTLTFSAANLIVAFNILRTMKDRKTGVYLNVMPDTLIVAPKLWWAVQQLIRSPQGMRVGDAAAPAEVYGTGTVNAFFNAINTIIVSPQFGNGYEWAMMEKFRAVTFQRVEPVQVLQEDENVTSESYLTRDVLRYRVRNWFGVGMTDDRFAFFSNSTTAPTVS